MSLDQLGKYKRQEKMLKGTILLLMSFAGGMGIIGMIVIAPIGIQLGLLFIVGTLPVILALGVTRAKIKKLQAQPKA